MQQLRLELDRASEAYYREDTPLMPDEEWDRQFRELKKLEASYPSLDSPNSPTHRVGSERAPGFAPHSHLVPMLSLTNAFNDEEVFAWDERNRRLVPDAYSSGYTVELKIDGSAVSLTYSAGSLQTGATRGDGYVGEAVTANLRNVGGVPRSLNEHRLPGLFEVRGEVYMRRSVLHDLNRQRAIDGDEPLKNCRNAAAGGLRQLDPRITRERRLQFFAYSIEPIEQCEAATQHELLELLRRWGFKVEPHYRHFTTLREAVSYCESLEAQRDKFDFDADGAVIKIDSFALQRELGSVTREPRWAIARKFQPEVARTRLREVRVNVGRTGAITPFALLEPVKLGGVRIEKATLHNAKHIQEKDIRVGDLVEVTRAGDVIPQVVRPITEERTGLERSFVMPPACPFCSHPIHSPPDEKLSYCANAKCPGRRLEAFVHFASRNAMDINGLGEERIRRLLEDRFLSDVADLYDLGKQVPRLELLRARTRADGKPGARLGRKSAMALVKSIDESRSRPLSRLVYALGIRHVGETAAKSLARHFRSLTQLGAATPEQLAELHGVGPTIAESVAAFFSAPENVRLLAKLASRGVGRQEESVGPSGGVLAGKAIVLTGSLRSMTRHEAKQAIENIGGVVMDSISRRTDFVVVGENAGSKLEKAKALGIPVWDEAELQLRLRG